LRPEAFELGGKALTLMAGLVENAGSETFVTAALGGREITLRLPGRSRVEAGQPLSLGVDIAHASFFDPQTTLRVG
jgi:ABC-type sugar transport system ATPase subunit